MLSSDAIAQTYPVPGEDVMSWEEDTADLLDGERMALWTAVTPGVFPKPRGEWEKLVIPLKRAGNLFLLEAVVDSVRGNFVLDFGATNLVLNRSYFPDDDRRVRTTMAQDATGASFEVAQRRVDRFSLQDLHYDNITADLTDLGAIENRRGVQILGLMGLDLFVKMDVVLDPRRNLLILQRNPRGVDEHPEPPRAEPVEIPMMLRSGALVVDARIAERRVRFGLDTGAEIAILDRKSGKRVLEKFAIDRRMSLSGSGGGTVEVLAGSITQLELGGHDFSGMRAVISDLGNLSEGYGTTINGLLGCGLMGQGISHFDFAGRTYRLYLYSEESVQETIR